MKEGRGEQIECVALFPIWTTLLLASTVNTCFENAPFGLEMDWNSNIRVINRQRQFWSKG